MKLSINKALLIFLIAVGISVLFSLDRSWSFFGHLERMMGYYTYLCFGVWFLFLIIFFKQKDFEQLFKFVAITGAFMALVGILQNLGVFHYLCNNTSVDLFLCQSDENQPVAFIGNPAFLASYLLLCAGATLLLEKKWWWLLIPTGICIVLCRVRGMYLAIILGAVVFLILYWLEKRTPLIKTKSYLRKGKDWKNLNIYTGKEDWKKKHYIPKTYGDSAPLFSIAHTKEDWKRIKKGLPKLIKKLNDKKN